MMGCLLLLVIGPARTQPVQAVDNLVKSFTSAGIPADLLATKTFALYQISYTQQELEQIQQGFERTGVDVVMYYPSDLPMSNRELQKVFSDYLIKREIKYLLFLQKDQGNYIFTFTEFDKTPQLAKPAQAAWQLKDKSLREISLDIYRTALNNQKRLNMLVSPLPETGLKLKIIRGQRNELYARDLRIDKLAVIKTGDAQWDADLESVLKANYPFNFTLFEPGTTESDVRKKGYLFALHYMNTRNVAAQELLGYDMSKASNAIASISYVDGQIQLKTIPANAIIYKFYFKHLENSNVYLGTKWDAETDWQQALLNQIKGLKTELKIN
jgi:hypothetical protein